MNKKIGIFMVLVLLVGAVFFMGCSNPDAVGRKISNVANGDGGADILDNRSNLTFRLTTSVNPRNAGNVTLTNGTYRVNTIITLTATANRNYTFSNWSGTINRVSNLSSRIIRVIMDRNRNLVANFRRR